MENILLQPPITFLIVLAAVFLLFLLFSWLAFKKGERTSEAYACGEEFSDHLIQPDYSQFFPFAFFFTILHVVALVIATAPMDSVSNSALAAVYVIIAILGLYILLRR